MTSISTASTASTPSTDASLLRQARKRVEMKMGFLVHAAVFVAVNAGLLLLGSLMGGTPRWSSLPHWGWALGLAIHGLVTALSLYSQDLRERLMEAELKALRERALR